MFGKSKSVIHGFGFFHDIVNSSIFIQISVQLTLLHDA